MEGWGGGVFWGGGRGAVTLEEDFALRGGGFRGGRRGCGLGVVWDGREERGEEEQSRVERRWQEAGSFGGEKDRERAGAKAQVYGGPIQGPEGPC